MTANYCVRLSDKPDSEHTQRWIRSERYFRRDGLIYFSTREGVNVGPFASKSMAERALELYKYVVNECSATGTYASYVVTHL